MNEFKYIYLNIYIINKNYYLFFYDIMAFKHIRMNLVSSRPFYDYFI